jgi:hypothetical protein
MLSFQAIPPGTAFFIALPILIRLTNCNCWTCDFQSDKRHYVAFAGNWGLHIANIRD